MEGIRIGRKTAITRRLFGAYVIYEHGISTEIPKRECGASVFDQIRGVWIAEETLSQVFIYLLNQNKKEKLNSQNLC